MIERKLEATAINPLQDESPGRRAAPLLAPFSEAWGNRCFRWSAVGTTAGLVATAALFREVLGFVEARPGVRLNDPLLAAFAPIEVNLLLFASIYGVVTLALLSMLGRPRSLLITFQAYGLLLLVRAATLALTPLDPPATMIELQDPLVELYLQSDRPLTRDLFFSGHVSTVFLFFLTARSGRPKACFLAAAALIGALLLQHVHYTIDVAAAPFFAMGSHRLVCWWWIGRPGELPTLTKHGQESRTLQDKEGNA